MPPNTVSVSRPGRFGNPFTVAYRMKEMGMSKHRAQETATALFRRCVLGLDIPNDPDYADRINWIRENIHLLRGKDLACWCRLDQKCHADILLELANQ